MRATQVRKLYNDYYRTPTVDEVLEYISDVIAVSAMSGYQSVTINCRTAEIDSGIKEHMLQRYAALWGDDEFFFKIIVDYLISDGFDVLVGGEDKDVKDRVISIYWGEK